MAYTKQTWSNGDVITKAKLDHIEDGIANAQSTADGAASSVNALSANGAIGTANLANGAVTAAKLGESATDIVADTFGTSTAYSVGDYCIYSGALYRFTADKSAGAWDSTKVVAIALADDVSDLKNAVTTNNNIILCNLAHSTRQSIRCSQCIGTGKGAVGKNYTTIGTTKHTFTNYFGSSGRSHSQQSNSRAGMLLF